MEFTKTISYSYIYNWLYVCIYVCALVHTNQLIVLIISAFYVVCIKFYVAMDHLSYGLLLEERVGYKKQDAVSSGSTVTYHKVKVLKGTLLITLSHEESIIVSHSHHVHNYKSMGGMGVSLYCDADQVYQITREQRDMLLGVRNMESRIEEVHKLEWVSSLDFGSSVYVSIPTISTPVRGAIRHVGKIRGQAGTMFGVELMVGVFM